MTSPTKRTALVIDGSSGIRLLLQTCVKRAGYEVEMADGCASAAELLSARAFDIVVTEVYLRDGSILKILREGYADLVPKTIILTSSSPRELSQHDLAGIGALLTKPFELTDLMECVRRVGGDEAPASIRWNVLVVDDDATFTYTMKRSFEGAGATVTATTSGEEAIRAVKSQQFDLIVVDLLLGKMLGVDILDEAAKHAPGMMRVAVSGSDDAIAALRADVAHAAYRKPVDFPTIAHVLAAAVKRN